MEIGSSTSSNLQSVTQKPQASSNGGAAPEKSSLLKTPDKKAATDSVQIQGVQQKTEIIQSTAIEMEADKKEMNQEAANTAGANSINLMG